MARFSGCSSTQRAQNFNASVDLSGVRAAGLDEMFSQGDPVLAGVDLDSNYVFLVEKRDQRTTKDWEEVLAAKKRQNLNIKVAVRDGGAAIAAGVTSIFPDAEQRDDNFHAQAVVTKILRKVENRAYATMGRIDALTVSLTKAKKGPNPNVANSAQLGDLTTGRRAAPAGGGEARFIGLGRARRAPKNEEKGEPCASELVRTWFSPRKSTQTHGHCASQSYLMT